MEFRKMHPFLIFSYLYKFILRLITPYFLFLIFQTSMDISYSIFNYSLLLIIIVLLFLIYGLFTWLTIKVKIDKKGRLIVKRYFFLQETVEVISVQNIMNVTKIDWFPGNIMKFTDFYIQLEGDEGSTIKLSCLRQEDYLSLNRNINKVNEALDERIVYPVPLREAILGFIGRGVLLSFLIIITSNLLSSISKYTLMELNEYLSFYFWYDNLIDLPNIIYLYAALLSIIFVIKNIFRAINYQLSILHNTNEVVITSGFFYKKQLKINVQNIKGFYLEQNVTQRFLKRTTFFIETVSEDKRKVILHPFLKKNDIERLYKFIFKDELNYQNIRLENNGRRKNILSILIFFIALYILFTVIYFEFIVSLFYFIPLSVLLFIIILSYFINYFTQKYYYFHQKNLLLVKRGVLNRRTFFLRDNNLNMFKTIKLPWHFQNECNYHLSYFNNSFKKRVKIKNVDWSKAFNGGIKLSNKGKGLF